MTDDDRVFKALADPTRRFLLDLLFERDGRTLTELESELEMTRFGVMKHLKVLEEAGLVVTRRSGREKLHFLNPVPIRLIHDRWIDKYTERRSRRSPTSNTNWRDMTSTTTTHRDRRATPRPCRSTASTSRPPRRRSGTRSPIPSGTSVTGTAAACDFDLRPGGAFSSIRPAMTMRGDAAAGARGVVDGEVIEADPPHRLVQTWRWPLDPDDAAEGFTRLTYEITEGGGPGVCGSRSPTSSAPPRRRGDGRGRSGRRAAAGGGGWPWVLSDLKTLLETGSSFTAG